MQFTSRHLRMFKIAKEISKMSDFPRTSKRVGAVYVKGQKIIAASNSMRTHPIAAYWGSRYLRLHCEMSVLLDVDDATDGELYVYRQHADGSNAMSRPCEFCIPMLLHKNLRHVYHTIDSGFKYLDCRNL